ncbi:uncharacterized protein LOC121751650 [Salvia splendens]|uniref:uncharacterized protein LOC121751650 n=1 Tax=Salvia splendens TaxID=180675 RepID=UPI001C2624FF|nr:uncharacterized protein LOC121751650 [Salvia splendens]
MGLLLTMATVLFESVSVLSVSDIVCCWFLQVYKGRERYFRDNDDNFLSPKQDQTCSDTILKVIERGGIPLARHWEHKGFRSREGGSADRVLHQLFVTVSPKLCRAVKKYVAQMKSIATENK